MNIEVAVFTEYINCAQVYGTYSKAGQLKTLAEIIIACD